MRAAFRKSYVLAKSSSLSVVLCVLINLVSYCPFAIIKPRLFMCIMLSKISISPCFRGVGVVYLSCILGWEVNTLLDLDEKNRSRDWVSGTRNAKVWISGLFDADAVCIHMRE